MARALASHGPVRLCSIAVISLLIPVLSFASFSRCGVWKNSITLWSDVLRHYPDMPVALFNRGAAYLELMEPDKAIADLQRLADMGGSSPALYLNMGQAYLVKNEYRGAISCFDKAIQADGSIFEAYHLRALCLIRLGDECGAITDLNRALELKPDVPEVKFIRDKLVQNNQRQVLPEAVIPPGPSSP
jgi:tetratricopeptide (TPR) repeat protein